MQYSAGLKPGVIISTLRHRRPKGRRLQSPPVRATVM